MLQKAKTSLLRLLIVLCLVCCLVAVVLTAAACKNTQDPTIVGAEMSNGELVLKWSDGTTTTLPLKGLDGTNGTNGTNGNNGKDGIGIKSVEWKNGKLHITFTEGDPVDIEITGEIPDVCTAHEDGKHDFSYASLHELEKATCTHGAITVNICECGTAQVIDDKQIDTANHTGLQPRGEAATCTTPGKTWFYCADCNNDKIDYKESDALQHTRYRLDAQDQPTDTENWIDVVDEGKNLCIDGGSHVLVCGRCFEYVFAEQDVEKRGAHEIAQDWTVVEKPTTTTSGALSGKCAHCQEIVQVEIPKLDETLAGVKKVPYGQGDAVEPSCNQAGKDVWNVTVSGYGDQTRWTGQFDKTVTTAHVFKAGGETVDLDKVYDKDEYKEYIHPIENVQLPTCEQEGEGIFKCDKCQGTYKVKISGSHEQGEQISKVFSTCMTRGYTEYKCLHNEKTEHTYKVYDYESEQAWIDAKTTLHKYTTTVSAGTAHQVCEYNKEHTNDFTLAKMEKDENASKKASCTAPGKDVYKYWLTDATGSGEPDGTYENELPILNHTNGQITISDADLKKDEYEAFNKSLVNNIIENATLATCLEEGEGTFVCQNCTGTIKVRIIGDHTYADTPTKTVPATCEAAGYDEYLCTVCKDYTDKRDNGTQALGHKYEGDAEQTINYQDNDPSKPIASITFTWTCENGCGVPKTVTGMPDEGHTDAKYGKGYEVQEETCTADGWVKFWYTTTEDPTAKDIIIRTIPMSRTMHKIGGKAIDISVEHKMSEYPGISEIENADPKPTCTSAGEATFTCDDCHKTWKASITLDHDWTDETKERPLTHPATCKDPGYTYRTCKICGEDIPEEDSTIPATGHSYKAAKADITAPTETATGSVTYRCENCESSVTVTLPALSKQAYTHGGAAATCESNGVETYTFTYTVQGSKDAYENVVITINTDALGHTERTEQSRLIEWTNDTTKTHNKGYFCDRCDKVIVYETIDLSFEEGTYTLSLFQAKRNDGKGETLYFTGEMSGYYLATATEATGAAELTITKDKDGNGYIIKVGTKFLEIVKNDTHINAVMNDTQTEGAFWHWRADLNTFTMTVDGTEYYLGTYNTFNTISPSAISYITGDNASKVGTDQFVGTYTKVEA